MSQFSASPLNGFYNSLKNYKVRNGTNPNVNFISVSGIYGGNYYSKEGVLEGLYLKFKKENPTVYPFLQEKLPEFRTFRIDIDFSLHGNTGK